jgi:hypothetical protein
VIVIMTVTFIIMMGIIETPHDRTSDYFCGTREDAITESQRIRAKFAAEADTRPMVEVLQIMFLAIEKDEDS